MCNRPVLSANLCCSVSESHNEISFCSDLQKNPAYVDLDDIQFVHQKLYPILFQYVDRFIMDEESSDALIADLFLEMVKSDELNGDLEHVILFALQNARKIFVNYLTEKSSFSEFVPEDFMEKTTYLDLLVLNAASAEEREIKFLKYALGFDEYEVAKIINQPHLHISQLGSSVS